MGNTVKLVLFVWIAVAFVTTPARGVSKLGTLFKKKYALRSVSCNTCHVKGEEKDVLNPFGKKIAKLLDGKSVAERVKAAKELEEEEDREEAEAQISEVILEALKKLDTMKTPCGKTYAEVIRAGEVEGTKARK